jgi:hypothetical protein
MHNYIRGKRCRFFLTVQYTPLPTTELLAFRAGKLAEDCPTGELLDCPGVVNGSFNYALVGSDPLFMLPDAVFEFPYTLARQKQRLTTRCHYEHSWGDSTLDLVGKIRKLAGEEAEHARRLLLGVHPSDCNDNGCSIVSFAVEQVHYSGRFPEMGMFGPEFLRDSRLISDRKQYPEVCQVLNECSTAQLLRTARHYLQTQPEIGAAAAVRVDSFGITMRAGNGRETKFLRIDFEDRVVSASDAEAQVREVFVPGYDKRKLANLWLKREHLLKYGHPLKKS